MIEDVRTGARIETVVLPVSASDLRALGRGWRFDWVEQAKHAEVFKLVCPADPGRILGLTALTRRAGSHVEVTLLESDPSEVGRDKTYRGIAGSLLAYAAYLSLLIGGEGFVAMDAKSELIDHYRDRYGFARVGKSPRMVHDPSAAAKLIRAFTGDAFP